MKPGRSICYAEWRSVKPCPGNRGRYTNYAPFGHAGVFPDPDGDGQQFALALRFPGQYLDGESPYFYNWHRYYDPSLGRYISADPIGQRGGVNLYTYARNNAVNLVDPFGLWSVTVSFFAGKGGSVTLGADDNGYFFSATAGVGLEAGIGFDPAGECSVQPDDFDDPVPGGSSFGMVGFDAGIGASAGPFGADYGISGGLGVADNEEGGLQSSNVNASGASGSVSPESGFSFGVGGHVGGTITMGGF